MDVSRVDAIILLILFVLFIIYTILIAKRGDKLSSEDGEMYLLVNENKKFSI